MQEYRTPTFFVGKTFNIGHPSFLYVWMTDFTSAEGHSRLTQRNVILSNATGLGLSLKQAERFEYDNFGNITQKWNTNHAGVRQTQGSAVSYRYNYAGNPYRLLDVTA